MRICALPVELATAPFRGARAEVMKQIEMLEAARREYDEDQVQTEELLTRPQANRAQVT